MGTRDDIIADLRQLVERQAKQIDVLTNEVDRLTKQVKVLRTEVTDLKIQLANAQKDSTTSSMAPSSDITGAGQKKNQGKPGRPRKRKAGGQPGRKRKIRENLPIDRVDDVIEYEICNEDIKR